MTISKPISCVFSKVKTLQKFSGLSSHNNNVFHYKILTFLQSPYMYITFFIFLFYFIFFAKREKDCMEMETINFFFNQNEFT